jgi:amidase
VRAYSSSERSYLTLADSLLESQNTTGYDSVYYKALAFNHKLGRTQGIDAALKIYKLDALVLPSGGYTTVPAAIGERIRICTAA